MTDITDKLAEALKYYVDAANNFRIPANDVGNAALVAYREAKAQPQEPPVAWLWDDGTGPQATASHLKVHVLESSGHKLQPLFCHAQAQPPEALPNQATVDEQLDAMVLAFAVERHFMNTPTPQDLERMAKKWKEVALGTFCSLAHPYLDKLREAEANTKAQPSEPGEFDKLVKDLDIVSQRLRYSDQDIDRGELPKARITAWDGHISIKKSIKALTTLQDRIVKLDAWLKAMAAERDEATAKALEEAAIRLSEPMFCVELRDGSVYVSTEHSGRMNEDHNAGKVKSAKWIGGPHEAAIIRALIQTKEEGRS
jgi:hypothetical protein